MKLDIDLNALSLQELKTVIGLADRQNIPKVQPVAVEKKSEDVIKHIKKHRQSSRYSFEDAVVLKVIDYLQDNNGGSIEMAYRKVTKQRKMPHAFYGALFRYCRNHKIDYKQLTIKKVGGIMRNNTFDSLVMEYKDFLNGKGIKGWGKKRQFVSKIYKENNKDLTKTKAEMDKLKGGQKSSAFPMFGAISPAFNSIFQGMIRKITDGTGDTELSYQMEGKLLDCTYSEWVDLLAEFMVKKDLVANFLNIRGDFHVIYNNNMQVLKYKK